MVKREVWTGVLPTRRCGKVSTLGGVAGVGGDCATRAQIFSLDAVIPPLPLPLQHHITSFSLTMSLFGSGTSIPKSPADVKANIVQQLQQESAMSNARLLIEVRHSLSCFLVFPQTHPVLPF